LKDRRASRQLSPIRGRPERRRAPRGAAHHRLGRLGSRSSGWFPLRGNLIPDAHLAALAIEHGVAVCSADTDFARFTDLRSVNPLAF
jgi:predicted nucleic acid-binding protein